MYKNKKILYTVMIILVINTLLILFQTIIVPNDLISSYNYLLLPDNSGISLKNYILIYSLFCMILFINIDYEKYYVELKYKSRKEYYMNYRLKNIVLTGIIYAFIQYFSIAIAGSFTIGIKNIVFLGYFHTSLMAVFYDIIYFIIIISLFNIANNYLNNKVLSMITIEIFLVINYIFNEHYLTLVDIPSKYSLFSMQYEYYKFIPVLLILLSLCCTLIYMEYKLFIEKDIL